MSLKDARFFAALFISAFFVLAQSCASMPAPPELEQPPLYENSELLASPDGGSIPSLVEENFLPLEEEPEEEIVRQVETIDSAEIVRRAEEVLPYLDTPVDPDVPLPEYRLKELAADENNAKTDDKIENIPAPPVEIAALEEIPVERLVQTEPALEISAAKSAESAPEAAPIESAAPPVEASPPEVAQPPVPEEKPKSTALPPLPARTPPNETNMRNPPLSAGLIEKPAVRAIQTAEGQSADIFFEGAGWVFTGETGGKRGLPYLSRRDTESGRTFIFNAETPGVYTLRFRRQNLAQGTASEELVNVTVTGKEAQAAPASSKPPAPSAAAAPLIAGGTTDSVPANSVPPPLLETAAETAAAPALEAAALPGDTVLWNKGQSLEAPGAGRDIKGALEAYRRIVRSYPQSPHYEDSRKRIAYLERFYLSIK